MSCCCNDPQTDLLNNIVQMNIGIAIRWSQVFQAGGITPPGAVSTSLASSDSSCSQTALRLLENLLIQRTAIYNAMFFG